MKILITGAKGFIGKNLIAGLKNLGYHDLLEYDIDTPPGMLEQYAKECGFVFHLAGVNRPVNKEEYMTGNFGFTSELLDLLKKHNNKAPVLITSSIQAELDNPYGVSKKAGEDLLLEYSTETGSEVFVYRLSNVFGKWCRPNYNSAVATFCNNIANGIPIKVNDPNTEMHLVYIDDVVDEFIRALNGQANRKGNYCTAEPIYTVRLGAVAELIYSFKESRETKGLPDLSDPFTKKLHSTYLSYLPSDQFSYYLKMNMDQRGSFTEFLKTPDRGQVSVNVSKPGIAKGNHWHNTKCEKFLVVSGKGVIRLRRINSEDVIEYHVSGDKLEVVDIPAGYTHNIENLGDSDMVTIMWVNEVFDKEHPDTYPMEV